MLKMLRLFLAFCALFLLSRNSFAEYCLDSNNNCLPASQAMSNIGWWTDILPHQTDGNCGLLWSGGVAGYTSTCTPTPQNDDCPNGDNSGSLTDGNCCSGTQVLNEQGQCVDDTPDDDCSTFIYGDLSGSPTDGSCACPSNTDEINGACVPKCEADQYRDTAGQCQEKCTLNNSTFNAGENRCDCNTGYGLYTDMEGQRYCIYNDNNNACTSNPENCSYPPASGDTGGGGSGGGEGGGGGSGGGTGGDGSGGDNSGGDGSGSGGSGGSGGGTGGDGSGDGGDTGGGDGDGTGDGSGTGDEQVIGVNGSFDGGTVENIDTSGIAGSLAADVETIEGENRDKATSVMNEAKTVLTNWLKPEITYSGGCSLGSVTYMNSSVGLDFCPYLPMLELLGGFLFLFANVRAIFIFLNVFTGGGK